MIHIMYYLGTLVKLEEGRNVQLNTFSLYISNPSFCLLWFWTFTLNYNLPKGPRFSSRSWFIYIHISVSGMWVIQWLIVLKSIIWFGDGVLNVFCLLVDTFPAFVCFKKLWQNEFYAFRDGFSISKGKWSHNIIL